MKNKTDALVIVAHPDDETIWMGGTIKKFRGIRWTIFSLCRKDDPDRAPKFARVCRYYQARGLMSNLEDEGIMGIKNSLPEIKKRLVRPFAKRKFTYIFTHGANGEYGHARHRGVHRAVKELVQKKILRCQRLIFFAYRVNHYRRIINPAPKNMSLWVKLNKKELAAKKNVVKKLYGFSAQSFENVSCLAQETFKIYS